MKPPKELGLLATQEELSGVIEEWAKYKTFVTDAIKKESGLTRDIDLLLFVVHKYHPELRIKKKIGAKTKWSELLNCMVAVEIDSLKRLKVNRKTAIETLLEKPMWNKLVKNSRDPYGLFHNADKAGRKSKLYPVAGKARKYSEVANALIEYQKDIEDLITEALKKN